MSFTTVMDGDTLQCRASIASDEELDLYIAHLDKQRDRLSPKEKKDGDIFRISDPRSTCPD